MRWAGSEGPQTPQFICRKEINSVRFYRRCAKPDIQLKRLPDFDLRYKINLVLATSDRREGEGGESEDGTEEC